MLTNGVVTCATPMMLSLKLSSLLRHQPFGQRGCTGQRTGIEHRGNGTVRAS